MTFPKPSKKTATYDNPVETMKDLGSGVVRDVSEIPAAILENALEQVGFKSRRAPMSGEINLRQQTTSENSPAKQEASLEGKLRQLRSVNQQEQEVFNLKKKSMEKEIRQIMDQLALEVKQLEVQTAELTADVRKVTVETVPSNPGVYHLNFFDWVIGTLRDLRKRVNESRLWLDVWTQKKKQKGYWAMFSKHGQKFAMSDERAIATGVG